MSMETLELRVLERGGQVFDFEYNFYDLDHKQEFEQKFLDEYYFSKIGQETVQRFKHRLRTKLNKINPYYSQLYKTYLETKDLDFMLNKDLREEFLREVDREGLLNQNTKTDSTSNTKNDTDISGTFKSNLENSNTDNTSSTNSNIADFKESNLMDGNASLELTKGNLTNVNNNKNAGESTTDNTSSGTSTQNDTNNSNTTNTGSLNSNNTGTLKNDTKDKEIEKTIFTSKGNIGVTSAADLLQKYRSILLNIDELILNECQDLFMLIY